LLANIGLELAEGTAVVGGCRKTGYWSDMKRPTLDIAPDMGGVDCCQWNILAAVLEDLCCKKWELYRIKQAGRTFVDTVDFRKEEVGVVEDIVDSEWQTEEDLTGNNWEA